MATKKKESTMKTAGVKNAAVITDGCNPELVKGADFDGIFEIPIIKAPEIIAIPKAIVPFSKRDKVTPSSFAICDYYRRRINRFTSYIFVFLLGFTRLIKTFFKCTCIKTAATIAYIGWFA